MATSQFSIKTNILVSSKSLTDLIISQCYIIFPHKHDTIKRFMLNRWAILQHTFSKDSLQGLHFDLLLEEV